MAKAKCSVCLGIASGETFEIAKSRIDHAGGLRRQRPCPNNSTNEIIEIIDDSTPKIVSSPEIITEPKKVEPITQEIPKNIKSPLIKQKPKKQTKPSKKPSIQ